MYKLLPKVSDFPISETTSKDTIPQEFLTEAVFAGGSFWKLEAAFGCVEGVVKTATGYYGGTLRKPSYREVKENMSMIVRVVFVTDVELPSISTLRSVKEEQATPKASKSYMIKGESHTSFSVTFSGKAMIPPIKTTCQNFGLSTHQRSAIFYSNEKERKQALESKIRKQMKLNKRIVTKIIPSDTDFFLAENQHQKYYLQKQYRLCETLGLRSTDQFVESNIACKLNGILAMDGHLIIDELDIFLETREMPVQTELAGEEIIEELRKLKLEKLKCSEDHVLESVSSGSGDKVHKFGLPRVS